MRSLPDFPWDTLAPYGEKARAHPGGMIDLSQGTPVDPTPEFIQKALISHANSPRYPLTAGTPELREALRHFAREHLGARGDFDVLPTIGSKEAVAWLPTILQSKKVLFPTIAYPTYRVGAMIAGSHYEDVNIDAKQWPESDLAWINSPSNPTGRVHTTSELEEVIAYARRTGSIVASDECYLDFPVSDVKPQSILVVAAGNNKNLLALHSLSKRSNMAGYRGACIIGDSELISRILEFRKHAGMMVPLPVQHAMVAALADQKHVEVQAERYRARRTYLASALTNCGFTIAESGAGLYIWCTRAESGWASVDFLAGFGILATPGSFYGSAGENFVRVALTASDSDIAEAANRLIAG